MASSKQNRGAVLNMAKVWDRMDALSRLSEIFPRNPRQKSDSSWHGMALVASFLIVLSLGLWGVSELSNSQNTTAMNGGASVSLPRDIFETALGEHSTVSLRDGTRVTLNTDSLISVEYTKKERLIFLSRGEMHVQVKHDKSRPLKVLTGRNVIQATGTAFAIKMNSDKEIELVVTDGSVEVSYQAPPQELPLDGNTISGVNRPVSVLAGHALLLDNASSIISDLDSQEIAVRLAWREGNLVFRGETLEEAVKEVSRYVPTSFIFGDDFSRNVRVAGRFKVGDIDGLLSALQENFDISSKRVDDKTIVLSVQNNH
jgi:transmembrane sensor